MSSENSISQLITVLNKAELYPNSEELADVLWLALQIDIPVIQNKLDSDNEEAISNQIDNKPPLENKDLPENLPEKLPEKQSTTQTQPQKSSLFPHQQHAGINTGGMKGQAFRTPALSLLHNALAFNRAFRPLRKTVASRFHTELAIEETVQYIAETQIFSPVLKGKPERWLELVILIDNAISMQIWQPLLKEFRSLLELQGTFAKLHFYQLDTKEETARVLNNQRVIKHFEIINPQQPRLILVVSDCVAKAWHSNQGVFALLQQWSRKHPVSILQMLPFRLWKGTALGYAEEARFTAALPLALNQALNLDRQDFWFVDDISGLEKGFKIPVLTLEPEIVKTWAKLVLGKQDSWLKGVVFDNPAALIPPVETAVEQKAVEITAEQRLKQFKSFASPTAQQLAAYLAAVPLDLSVMNVVQKLMLPQSSQVHLAEVFLGGLLKRVADKSWVKYEFHAGVRELLLDSVIVADAVFVLTRVSDFVEQRFGQSLDFLALLANPSLTDGIALNESTRPFAEVGAKILKRLGGEYEKLVDTLENNRIEEKKTNEINKEIDDNTIKWLHLSDFHVGLDSYEQTQLFKHILKHIEKNKAKKGNIDFIFITGDIAQSGSAKEYEKFAKEFIFLLKKIIGKSCKIFTVAGNHDVDRKKQNFFSRNEILSTIDFFDPTKKGLEKRQDILKHFEEYRKFQQLHLDEEDWLNSKEGCFIYKKQVKGINLGILGLNTAWLSGADNDKGYLTVGKAIIENALEKIQSCDVKIILGHHPIDWFYDNRVIRTLFAKNKVIYLHGHLHKGSNHYEESAGNQFLTIQSGTAFQGREDDIWINGLIWAELDFDTKTINLEPYKWGVENQEWRLDVNVFPEMFRNGGIWKLSLPQKIESKLSGEQKSQEKLQKIKNIVGQTPRGSNFYQRQGLLKQLYRRLENNAHLYMAGPRRMGKTAIMRYLEDNKHHKYCAVYVITESIDNSEQFFKVILEELLNNSVVGHLKKFSKVTDKFINARRFKKLEGFGLSFELNNVQSSYYQELQTLLRGLHDVDSELKLIIMIDEFAQTVENILRKHGEVEAVQFLQLNRELRQQVSEGVLFLTTGSIGLPVLAEKLDATKTINDLNVFEIPPLTDFEAKDLLSRLLESASVPYQESYLDLLLSKLEWFSPYHIQLLAQEFIDQYDLYGETINEATIDKAFHSITDRRNDMNFAHYYSRLQNSFTADELAFALAALKKLCQQASLNLTEMQILAQNLKNFEFVLRALEFDGYIFKTQQQEWRFTSPLLKLWWTQYINA